ncbi:hypothetical protein HZS_6911, partial [Henneguya salminicola]
MPPKKILDIDEKTFEGEQIQKNHIRIFANRDILFEKVKFYGFDMDYTIAEYISPFYEELALKHAIKLLLEMGYPSVYNPKIIYLGNTIGKIRSRICISVKQLFFYVSGVIFDTKLGNFLKTDPYGNIMTTVYGLQALNVETSRLLYANRFINLENKERFVHFYTLFELPSMFLISFLIYYFEKNVSWN